MAEKAQNLTDILNGLAEKSEQEKLELREVLMAFGSRSHGPLLFLPAFIVGTPPGAIPGVAIGGATLIVLISFQVLFSPRSLWLPEKILSLKITGEKLEMAIRWSRPTARFIDRFLRSRLDFVFQSPFSYAVAVLCLAMGLAMYPLAFFPFAASAPALAVALFGLGLISEDGIVILIALATSAGSLGFTGYLLNGFSVP